MPRRGNINKRDVNPDAKYNSKLVPHVGWKEKHGAINSL